LLLCKNLIQTAAAEKAKNYTESAHLNNALMGWSDLDSLKADKSMTPHPMPMTEHAALNLGDDLARTPDSQQLCAAARQAPSSSPRGLWLTSEPGNSTVQQKPST
jgi:hypothetical protein